MFWVVLGHTYLLIYKVFVIAQNRMFAIRGYTGGHGLFFEIIMNGLLSVDTFFFLSGLLVAYISFLQLEKKQFNIIVYYVHRYVRLTIPMAFGLGLYACIVRGINSGPVFEEGLKPFLQSCKDNSYQNFLYINNFFSQDDIVIT